MNRIISLVFLFLIIASCGDEMNDPVDINKCDGFSVTQAAADELITWQEIASQFVNDPSKCNEYIEAGNTYILALRELEDCAREAGQLDLFNMSLDAALEELNNTNC